MNKEGLIHLLANNKNHFAFVSVHKMYKDYPLPQ